MFEVGDKTQSPRSVAVRLDGHSFTRQLKEEKLNEKLFLEWDRIVCQEYHRGEMRLIVFALSQEGDKRLTDSSHFFLYQKVCRWCEQFDGRVGLPVNLNVVCNNQVTTFQSQKYQLSCYFLICFNIKKYLLLNAHQVRLYECPSKNFYFKLPFLFKKFGWGRIKKDKHWLNQKLDMVIQTENQRNMSRFFLHNVAYSEFFFLKEESECFNMSLWNQCREDFSCRNRRYGS